jgi:hypothetical protein
MLTKDNRTKKLEQKGLKMKFFFFFLFSFSISLSAHAQCAMCRAALESEEGGVQAEAVNDGIVYLMAIPYILVGILGFAIYRIKYGKKKSEQI